jgi:hypothetical protein
VRNWRIAAQLTATFLNPRSEGLVVDPDQLSEGLPFETTALKLVEQFFTSSRSDGDATKHIALENHRGGYRIHRCHSLWLQHLRATRTWRCYE